MWRWEQKAYIHLKWFHFEQQRKSEASATLVGSAAHNLSFARKAQHREKQRRKKNQLFLSQYFVPSDFFLSSFILFLLQRATELWSRYVLASIHIQQPTRSFRPRDGNPYTNQQKKKTSAAHDKRPNCEKESRIGKRKNWYTSLHLLYYAITRAEYNKCVMRGFIHSLRQRERDAERERWSWAVAGHVRDEPTKYICCRMYGLVCRTCVHNKAILCSLFSVLFLQKARRRRWLADARAMERDTWILCT